MKYKNLTWLALLTALVLVLAACGNGEEEAVDTTVPETTTTVAETTTTTVAETTTTEPAPMIELVIWADEKRAEAIEEVIPPLRRKPA